MVRNQTNSRSVIILVIPIVSRTHAPSESRSFILWFRNSRQARCGRAGPRARVLASQAGLRHLLARAKKTTIERVWLDDQTVASKSGASSYRWLERGAKGSGSGIERIFLDPNPHRLGGVWCLKCIQIIIVIFVL
jgi:hypothetical protein